uniref:Holin n=1 Tax=Siphoviridae sp. ctpbe1 TaxID=2826466 RepID=A0A8S5NQA8_9CAUD|nr:MAG TPA: holin [Siphoviridae sp. ctpbe1]
MPKLNKRSWIPLIGWILCYGFLNNCVIAPYFDVELVDWEQLLTSLAIMLGISGVRDIGIKRKSNNDKDIKTN